MKEDFPPFYRRIRAWVSHRNAIWVLGGASVAESIVSPLPPDFLLAPMVVAQPERAWQLAFLTSLTSVAGGIGGYLIGAFLMDYIGWAVVDFYHLREPFMRLMGWLREYGAVVVLIGALSPIPYKAIALMSGASMINPALFIGFSLIGRSTRFYLVAALCKIWGGRVEQFLITHLLQSDLRGLISLIFLSAFSVLAGAFFFEYVLGYAPCMLCLWQRWPYYIVIGLCFISLFMFSEKIYFWVAVLSALVFLGGAGLGFYHWGIEQGFWQGSLLCGGGGELPASAEGLLLQLETAQPISCAHAPWKFLGLSLAAYNVIISLLLSSFIFWKIKYGRNGN